MQRMQPLLPSSSLSSVQVSWVGYSTSCSCSAPDLCTYIPFTPCFVIAHSSLSENLPGASGSAFLDIMVLRMGKPGALFIWAFVCLTAFFVCQTALQAASRTVYAFSRDKGLPDRGFFGHNSTWTQTPLRAIWLVTLLSILPGLLDLASPIAANAIFALTAMALDLSYIIPIFLCVFSFLFFSLLSPEGDCGCGRAC